MLVKVSGRLDASWSGHFTANCREYIRQGHHHLLLDSTELSYLSSAGIRALVQVTKSLTAVNGSFRIVQANDFVQNTLSMTGFGSWISSTYPEDMPAAEDKKPLSDDAFQVHVLDESATLKLTIPAGWMPWKAFDQGGVATIRFGQQDFALGIGAPGQHGTEAASHMGEFIAVGGNVVCQSPREGEDPDFLLAEKEYLPEMQCMQALHCKGKMSHLLRFSPKGNKIYFGLGELARKVLRATGSSITAFVTAAEIDGLVGSVMIQSPGLLQNERAISFPEIKEWLSFCGERVHPGQKVLIFGLAAEPAHGKIPRLLPASKLHQGLYLHAHAAVFPYQPLESGLIQLEDTTAKLFHGPPPMALYHLVEDDRPATGLGESALIRGACWCAAITNHQEDTLWA